MKDFRITEKDIRIYNMLMDIPLQVGHPRHELQKQFNLFATKYPEVEIETNDFYNDGGCVGIHFNDDEFIIVCDMDSMTIESSILTDYENCLFDILETIPFTWESLESRLNDMIAIAPWTETFADSDNVNEARGKASSYLKDKWKQNEFTGNK